MTVQQWSTTASDNDDSPPTGAPEGMTPGSVNNTMREMMASVAIEAQVNRVKYLGSVAGTNTVTGSMTPALTAYSAGMLVVFTPAGNNTGATTLNINSLGALDVQKADGDALVSGDLVSGIPAVLVLDSGADDWILLNPQTLAVTAVSTTGGVTATGTVTGGAVTTAGTVTGGALSISGNATINGVLTTDNTTADEAGFKGLPQNAQTGNYTLVLTDAGKHIYHSSAAGSGDTYTIPANSSVAFPVGTSVTFINRATATVAIAITTDTMTLVGTTSTGTRTLAQNGVATAFKDATTSWLISGSGIT